MNPLFRIDFSISDSLKIVRKSVLIYETIILKEETYIGHSVHNKQTNISFKNKKKVRKPKEEWYLSLIHI